MPTHKAGVTHKRNKWRLHTRHVGDQPVGGVEGVPNLTGNCRHRSGHEGQLGSRVVTGGVDGTDSDRRCQPVSIGVPTGHMPAGGLQGEPDGCPYESGADHHRPATRCSLTGGSKSTAVKRHQWGRSSRRPTASWRYT